MNITRVTSDYSVSSQITVEEIAGIAALGFRSIMCNRPDGEEAGQTAFGEIENAARAAGLAVAFVPVVSGRIMQENVEDFRAKLAEMPGPVLAYCRSGARSQNLWQLSR